MTTNRWQGLMAPVLVGWVAWHGTAQAQLVINDTLTGASSSYPWVPNNGACLTAGNGTGTIPACVGLSYYSGKTLVGGANGTLPDAVGQGALRLTNGDNSATGSGSGTNQTGAVVSNFTFPSNQGLNVTFTTVTYGGNNYNGTGADGISFFLMDALTASGGANPASNGAGALGGSLGYSCSNVNSQYDGVVRGYVGIGIDEFGNFSNPGDNTDTGPGFHAGRISLRGAGDTNFASLHALYPTWYPANANKADAVHNTCSSGHYWNYSNTNNPSQTNTAVPLNYPLLAYSDLPSSTNIANQESVTTPTRTSAVPITYSLQITQTGIINLTYSVNGGSAQQVLNNASITASNGPLPANFRFGFSAGTGGGSNVHEITCFKAAPVSTSESSAGTNVQQSARVEAGAQVYLAYYHPTNWWGQLTAQSLLYSASTDTVSINTTANWDAGCTLTGGTCQATGSTVTATAPTARKILTWSGTAGIPFEWSSLTAAQQTALTVGDATATDLRLRYVRGDRSNEVANAGTLRTRTGVLGDIIDSSPTWVGPPTSPYVGPWTDALYGGTAAEGSGQSYTAFKTAAGTRQNVVYVGANDGMLHGFRAGGYDSTGAFVSSPTPNDGVEILGYVPATVLSTLHEAAVHVDYPNAQYSHNFYVDATPGVGDLYYNGAWHTWLVGGLGAGGNAAGPIGDNVTAAVGAIYGLDVTDPSAFSEANAGTLVLGEWTSSATTNTITCVNLTGCNTYLGSSVGTPLIRRLHNGNWAVLFGNGLNSTHGSAGLFIMLVDSATGNRTFRYIDTGSGPLLNAATGGLIARNGIAYVTAADLDGDHITDYVYAGDLFGNVWRFDLTSSNPASWSVRSAPIFTTSAGQPITTRVLVDSIPGSGASGGPRVIVSFGTGQQQPQTLTSSTTFASGAQALYGIWDADMSAWNALSPSVTNYATLASAGTTVPVSSLTTQTVLATTSTGSGPVSGYRTVSANKVCWSGSTICTGGASANTKLGWTLALPTSTEQIIYNPVMAYGMFVVNTTIPAQTQVLSCNAQPASGFTMAVTITGGGASTQSFFGDANNNFVTIGGSVVSGVGVSGVGTPSFVTANGKPYLVQQTVGGTGDVRQTNPGVGTNGSRVNWIKLR